MKLPKKEKTEMRAHTLTRHQIVVLQLFGIARQSVKFNGANLPSRAMEHNNLVSIAASFPTGCPRWLNSISTGPLSDEPQRLMHRVGPRPLLCPG
jgi:hypothetical protein